MIFGAFPFLAHAQWVTNTDDDIFTNSKKATMMVPINEYSDEQLFIFDCTKNDLSFAYIEKNKDSSDAKIPVEMIAKVDSGEILKMDGLTSKRNDNYYQIGTDDREAIISLLKSAKKAKSKMIVGLNIQQLNIKQSFSASTSGSTKAIAEFTSACGININ